MKCLLVINPAAGQGRPDESISDLEAALHPYLHSIVITHGAGDAEAAARDAAAGGTIDAVIVSGGDGTVNEVINGLFTGQPDGRDVLPLGIIASGTSNVLAHDLSILAGDWESMAGFLRDGQTRTIDVGRVNGRYFSLTAGFGFDAAVIREVLKPVKEIIGPAAYAFAALGALAKYRSTAIRLRLDGEEIVYDAFLVIVANAPSYAYRGIQMAPLASMTDGWLDVCIFEKAPMDKVGFVTQIMAVLARRHLRDPRVRYYRARRIEIDSIPSIQGQVDGDMYGRTPFVIEILPRALTLFAPPIV